MDIERQIQELTKQVAELQNRQLQMSNEIVLLERQLKALKEIAGHESKGKIIAPMVSAAATMRATPSASQSEQKIQEKPKHRATSSFQVNRELEDFIGTNVISKIGILVTIIGVFIGAKYAIDNELISPVLRIVLGYIVAFILAFTALRMKERYTYFSSVLMAGALAVTYFITYIAYGFYGLFPMWLAFIVMIITTGAAVAMALWYNQKVIALIGQIAAYAIPFLLGNKSGNVFGLFAYISCINVGLLILSLKKDWKVLYHIAFFLTWSVYLFWLVSGTAVSSHFSTGLFFLSINFLTFYITFLSYKVFKKEQYRLAEIAILLLNALFYFFLGNYLINETFQNSHFLTWFTLANAFIHFITGYFIYRLQLADNTVFQFVLGLGLLFITVAVPIELDGNWVTLLWTVEATTLFYIAAANQRILYLDIAVPLVIIAVLSLIQDWSNNYSYFNISSANPPHSLPFANLNFFLSLFVCGCLGYISFTAQKSLLSTKTYTVNFFKTIIPLTFLVLLYFALYNEINFAWDKIIDHNSLNNNSAKGNNASIFQSLSLIIFSCLYVASWFYLNLKWLKKEKLQSFLLLSGAMATVVLITRGLYLAGELRENYLSKQPSVDVTSMLLIRYLSLAALAILWINAYYSLKTFKASYSIQAVFSSLFNLALLTVISNEFIQWMDLAGYQNQYKLGLSLIGGVYALGLIFIGITKNKKLLRILGIVLFGITLLKLFFYDLASLSTVSKTVVLVLLGILLLLASFLYNKYKNILSEKEGG